MKKSQLKWFVDASISSGQVLGSLNKSKCIGYVYPFASLYSFLKGEHCLKNMKQQLPFGVPPCVFLSLGDNQKYKKGEYTFRSTLDGSRQKLDTEKLMGWLNQFDQVILPKEMLDLPLDNAVNVFIDHHNDYPSLASLPAYKGIALNINRTEDLGSLIDLIKAANAHQFYLYGDTLSLVHFQSLSLLDNVAIQSNAPFIDALAGVCESLVMRDTQHVSNELDIKPLVDKCLCATCLNHTRSYLHHLYQHTPILAVQLLATHNFHCWRTSLSP